jgi:hypothetical protein
MATRGARQKLNSIYITGAAIVAGFVGLMFKSITVFIICLGGLVAAMFHDGSLRPKPTRRRG